MRFSATINRPFALIAKKQYERAHSRDRPCLITGALSLTESYVIPDLIGNLL